MAVQNAENGVIWGGYGALKVMDNATIRYSTYDFLFDFNRNYVSIFYRFHRLRGSASPVLTATGFVNARGQFLAPTESTPLD